MPAGLSLQIPVFSGSLVNSSSLNSKRQINFNLTKLQVTLYTGKHSRKAICWPTEWNHCEALIGTESSSSMPFTALNPQ